MTFSIAVNRDELDCLRTDVETLEVCSELTASGSRNKARVAILILDHFADILLFRESKKILEGDRFRRWVLKPEFTPSEGEKTLYNFSKKLNLVAGKAQGVAKVDQAVLLIAHSYRNAIYHRDIHNERTTLVLAKLMLRTIFRLFMNLGSSMGRGGFNSKEQLQWLKPYIETDGYIDFCQVRRNLVRAIAPVAQLSFRSTRAILVEDITLRGENLKIALPEEFGDKWESWLDGLLKHVQFEHDNQERLDALSKVFRETTYKVHTDQPQTKEEYVKAESDYKARRTKEFDAFHPTFTSKSILSLHQLTDSESQASNLETLIFAYKAADDLMQKAESYFSMARSEFDWAVESAINAGREK